MAVATGLCALASASAAPVLSAQETLPPARSILFDVHPMAGSGGPAAEPARVSRAGLDLDVRRELWLLSVVGRLALASEIVREPVHHVPAAGLDPSRIAWSFDRGFAARSDPGASRASDGTRQAALLLPVVVSALTARDSRRLRDVAVGAAVYAEALLLTDAVTRLGKILIGRPRPGTYLLLADPADPEALQPMGSGAFHSMPSSHASTAWTGTAAATTGHLLLRPEAGWAERFGVGFVGGGLAGATSALRVRSGAHFPSDVLAGAGIGIASGVLVPLAHRGDRPLPGREDWLPSVAGTAVGAVLGVLLAGG